LTGTRRVPLWRDAQGPCPPAPACLPRPNGVAGELQNKFSSLTEGTWVNREFAEQCGDTPLPANVKRTSCVPNRTRPRMLLETPTLVSAFQIFCYLINEGIINEMRKTKPQTATLINKTLLFCQEKNNPVYVMWTD